MLCRGYLFIYITKLLTNAKGEPEETYSYGPYGELLSGDRTKTSYLYNGMYGVATDDNGLYYMRARYYNVSIKRFINQDIVNGSITNSQSLNKFSYVQGNPIKLTDPFGLFSCISLSGISHTVLDLLGVIPLFEACDAINAAWYLFEGDYANAALCMTAAIPVVGSLGTGTKWGIKAGAKADKVAETVKLGSKISTKGKGFAVSGGQTLETVKNVYKYVVKAGETANWSDAVEYTKLGLKVASMGDLGASIAKNGPALKAMSKGQDVVEAAPISNATRRVVSESGEGTYFKMNLQFFAKKKPVSSLKKIINNIPDNLKLYGKCDEFAQSLKKSLEKEKIPYKIIRIDSEYGIYSDKVGMSIGTGYHYGIQIGDMVYDNMTTGGMKLNDWLDDLGLTQGFPGVKWDYSTEIVNH